MHFPRTPDFVKEFIDRRGKVIPQAFNMWVKFDMAEIEVSPESPASSLFRYGVK